MADVSQYTLRHVHDAITALHREIQVFSKASRKQTRWIIGLTWVIGFLTLVMTGAVIVQVLIMYGVLLAPPPAVLGAKEARVLVVGDIFRQAAAGSAASAAKAAPGRALNYWLARAAPTAAA